MKTIPLTFDDADYNKLKRIRERVSKAKSWEAFIMELINGSNIRQRIAKRT